MIFNSIMKVRYNLANYQRGGERKGELIFSKFFCKLIRNLQFNSRIINKEIRIKSANSNLEWFDTPLPTSTSLQPSILVRVPLNLSSKTKLVLIHLDFGSNGLFSNSSSYAHLKLSLLSTKNHSLALKDHSNTRKSRIRPMVHSRYASED